MKEINVDHFRIYQGEWSSGDVFLRVDFALNDRPGWYYVTFKKPLSFKNVYNFLSCAQNVLKRQIHKIEKPENYNYEIQQVRQKNEEIAEQYKI